VILFKRIFLIFGVISIIAACILMVALDHQEAGAAGKNPFKGCRPVYSFFIESPWSKDGYSAENGETLCGIVVTVKTKNQLWRVRGLEKFRVRTYMIPRDRNFSNAFFAVEWPHWEYLRPAVLLTKKIYYASWVQTPLQSAVVYAKP
jgi:hypothetical protein